MSPSQAALDLAAATGKDARLVALVLGEASGVVRAASGVLIVRHRLGLVMANAGIDQSNLSRDAPGEWVLLLPVDPDASARAVREGLRARTGAMPGEWSPGQRPKVGGATVSRGVRVTDRQPRKRLGLTDAIG